MGWRLWSKVPFQSLESVDLYCRIANSNLIPATRYACFPFRILLSWQHMRTECLNGFARSLHTNAKAPRACSRLPGNFCNGVVSVCASYSVFVFCQFGAVLKHCRQHQQTLLHCKSRQAISSMLVCKDLAKPCTHIRKISNVMTRECARFACSIMVNHSFNFVCPSTGPHTQQVSFLLIIFCMTSVNILGSMWSSCWGKEGLWTCRCLNESRVE